MRDAPVRFLVIAAVAVSALAVAAAGGARQAAVAQRPGEAPAAATAGATRGTPTPAAAGKGKAVFFAADVMPLVDRLGCSTSACHGAAAGKGNLRLSLFGAYPEQDYAALTRAAPGRRVNTVEPRKSLLLLKVTGASPHAGGAAVQSGSPEHALLLSWITGGARWADAAAARPVAVEVEPAVVTLRTGESRQLRAHAVYSDGTRSDMTAGARYASSDPGVAEVTDSGRVTARGCGEAFLTVAALRRAAVVRVAVPQTAPDPFPEYPANNRIDELVVARLRELGIPPSPTCSDAEFLRRAFLDVVGILPTPDEARAFLADADPAKRARLVDRLLDRPEFADFWAHKWGDLLRIKSEYPSNLWPNAVQAYARWVRDSIAAEKPYDQFVRELLVSSGSNFRSPPANYYRALRKRDAQGYAEATALVFMGARLECARCHAHPTENWTLRDNLGMAAFFAQVKIKGTQEWKEEIVYVDPEAAARDPSTGDVLVPTPLGGQPIPVADGRDPREALAAWLTAPDNPWFARAVVNRVWYWLFGRGIVHEPDDIRPTNPPTNPELLAHLEKELVEHGYDLKHVYRLILASRTYQQSSEPNRWNARDVAHFARYPARRLGAEQLLDAIGQVTETSEEFSSRVPEPYTYLPDDFRAAQVDDGTITTPFLELFGRPPRDSAHEGDRSWQTSMRQALHMANSSHVGNRIARSPRLRRLLREAGSDDAIIEEVYLAALSRPPTDEERRAAAAYIARDKAARKQAVEDVVWAVLNTKEFLFNH